MIDLSSIPCVSVAITKANETFAFAYGQKHVTVSDQVSINTQFDVASQTKLSILVAALYLSDERKLDLHAPLNEYAADVVPVSGKLVTAYDVLTHQSGLPRDFAPEYEQLSLCDAIDQAIKYAGFSKSPAYSNLAYAMLAGIIERITGTPIEEYLAKLWADIGLQHTSCGGTLPDRAAPHGPDFGQQRNVVVNDPEKFLGAMGVWSTPTDMCRLVSVFTNNQQYLSRNSQKIATSLQWGRTHDTDGREHGLGLEVRWMNGLRWYGHAGGARGFMSATYFCLQNGYSFSVAINARDVTVLEQITETIAIAITLFDGDSCGDDKFAPYLGIYQSELGYMALISNGTTCFEIDPLRWDPLHAALPVEFVAQDYLRLAGTDFVCGNLPIKFLRNSDGEIQFVQSGILKFERISPDAGC